jgi:hypothetical protein
VVSILRSQSAVISHNIPVEACRDCFLDCLRTKVQSSKGWTNIFDSTMPGARQKRDHGYHEQRTKIVTCSCCIFCCLPALRPKTSDIQTGVLVVSPFSIAEARRYAVAAGSVNALTKRAPNRWSLCLRPTLHGLADNPYPPSASVQLTCLQPDC